MQVVVNGKACEVQEGETLSGLLARMGIDPSHRAIALNREVVHREQLAHTCLREGDRIEIVQAVGGG